MNIKEALDRIDEIKASAGDRDLNDEELAEVDELVELVYELQDQ